MAKQQKGLNLVVTLFPIIAAIVGGAWAVFVHFSPSPSEQPKTEAEAQLPQARATSAPIGTVDHGSISIGGDVSNSSVSTTSTPPDRKH